MAEGVKLHIQVCYARPQSPLMIDLEVKSGATIESAILASGVLLHVPEIDLHACKAGIYGKIKPLDTVLREGDRIEIYRPLIADPKEARRRRVVKKNAR